MKIKYGEVHLIHAPEEEPGAGGAAPEDIVPEDLWEGLAEDLDNPDTGNDDPAPADPEPDPEPAPEDKGGEPEPEPEPEEPDPEPEPEPEPEPAPAEPEPAQPVAQVPTPEELSAQQDQILGALEQRFQMTEEESLQLLQDPAKVMPKLQARLFMDTFQTVMDTMKQLLPDAIENTLQVSQVRQEKVKSFFETWPKLDKAKHGADIARAAQVYATLNPDATEEELIRDVGLQVMAKHGIPLVDEPAPEPDPEPTPPPRQPSAVHNRGSSGGALNLYEAMSEELLSDDD